jgi:uncharacterized membrane protein YfcA
VLRPTLAPGSGHRLRAEVPVTEVFRLDSAWLPPQAVVGGEAAARRTGIALGIGGIAGGYLGARMQSRLPDILIRRIVGVLAVAIAAQFLWNGLS